MGITGLLPFITNAQQGAIKTVSIRDFKGQTAAIDGYVLLHRSAFSCAKQLFEGEDTNVFILHCMRYMDMLQKHGVRPLLVFDGADLDVKRDTERQRGDMRKAAKKQAFDLLSAGKTADAYQAMARSINVTHKMALLFIQAARKRGIDSIVAPYEADAQLTYLTRAGLAHFVITEDSDLIVFGCEKILFKLQLTGEGRFYDKSLLQRALCAKKIRCNVYSFDKFRIACILSGCDYIKSLPGIGLAKAWKFASITDSLEDLDFKLPKMAQYLNMSGLIVSEAYIEQVKVANGAFKHQIVYDPVLRRRRPLEEFHEDNANCVITTETVGQVEMNERESLDRALGNIDPMSGEHLDTYCPSNYILNNPNSIWNHNNNLLQATVKSNTSKNVITTKLDVLTTSSEELEAEDVKLTALLQMYTKIDCKISGTVKDEEIRSNEEGIGVEFNEILNKNPFVKKIQDLNDILQSNNKENIEDVRIEDDNSINVCENEITSSVFCCESPNQNKNVEKCPFKKRRNNKYDQLFVQKRKVADNDYFTTNGNKKIKVDAVKEQFSPKENLLKNNTSVLTNKYALDLKHPTTQGNFAQDNNLFKKLNANIECSSVNGSNIVVDVNLDAFPDKIIVNKELETLNGDVDVNSVQSEESDDLMPIDQMLDCILETNDNDDADVKIADQNSPLLKRYKKSSVIKKKSVYSSCNKQTNLLDFFKKM